MKNNNKNMSGITLIALVVTIVVLIILASISIATLIGDNGITNNAKEAKKETEISEEKEKIQVSAVGAAGRHVYGKITEENLEIELNKNIGKRDEDYSLKVVGEKFIVTYLESNRSYTIDQDGNILEGEIAEETPPDPDITNPETPPEVEITGTITFGNAIWSRGKAKITISTDTSYTIQYQKNTINGTWKTIANGEQVTELNHGDTVYARLWNGKKGGENTSVDIIDKGKPVISNMTTSNITVNSMKLSVTASDAETGLASSGTYKYYLNGNLQETTVDSNYTYTGLTLGTEYTLRVEVVDKAGNAISSSTTATTIAIGDYVDYTPQTSIASYTFEATYTGYSTNQTLPQENFRWRLLDVNEDGTVELIAENSTTNQLYLKGALGYNNGVYLLNDYCKTLYSNSSKGAVARSVNMDDIEEKMNLSVWDYHNSSFGLGYGYTVSHGGILAHIPYQWYNDESNSDEYVIDGEVVEGTLDRSEQNKLTTQTYLNSIGANVIQNAWGNQLSGENFYNSIYEELLCESKYWIASRTVYNSSGQYSYFSISSSSGQGSFYPTGLFTSSAYVGNKDTQRDILNVNSIIPVVTIPSNNVIK